MEYAGPDSFLNPRLFISILLYISPLNIKKSRLCVLIREYLFSLYIKTVDRPIGSDNIW